jgi:hypothetical protein
MPGDWIIIEFKLSGFYTGLQEAYACSVKDPDVVNMSLESQVEKPRGNIQRVNTVTGSDTIQLKYVISNFCFKENDFWIQAFVPAKSTLVFIIWKGVLSLHIFHFPYIT